MRQLVFVLPLLGALCGGVLLLSSMSAMSAPQQAARAAMACALAVIPYVFARALAEMIDHRTIPAPAPSRADGPYIPPGRGAGVTPWSNRTKALVGFGVLFALLALAFAARMTGPDADKVDRIEKARQQDELDRQVR